MLLSKVYFLDLKKTINKILKGRLNLQVSLNAGTSNDFIKRLTDKVNVHPFSMFIVAILGRLRITYINGTVTQT